MVWNGQAIARLKKLLAANCGYREIGMILGCSASAVDGQVHRLGLPTKRQAGRRRAENFKAKPQEPLANIFFDGEPLVFADTAPPCARCGVREDVHRLHGCARFTGELRVRER